MRKWAVSILAVRGLAISVSHGAAVVEADSEDEAFGKATRLALKAYPEPEWSDHSVAVHDCDNVVTPEGQRPMEAK